MIYVRPKSAMVFVGYRERDPHGVVSDSPSLGFRMGPQDVLRVERDETAAPWDHLGPEHPGNQGLEARGWWLVHRGLRAFYARCPALLDAQFERVEAPQGAAT